MHDRDKETEQLNNDELAECKSLSRDAETDVYKRQILGQSPL